MALICENNHHDFAKVLTVDDKFECQNCGVLLTNDEISKLEIVCDTCGKILAPTWKENYCSIGCIP